MSSGTTKSFVRIGDFISKLLVLLTALCCFLSAFKNLDTHPVGVDAGEALIIAQNLITHNQFALQDKFNNGALYATNFREPLPIFLWAESFKLFAGSHQINHLQSLRDSKDLIKAKYASLLFLGVLLIAIPMLVYAMPTNSLGSYAKPVLAISIILLLNLYGFIGRVNAFSNDLQTGAFLCLLMVQWIHYFKKPTTIKLMLIGVVYGLLCLTKATFFYSGLIVFALVIAYQIFQKISIKPTLVVLLAAMIVTTPWILRNYLETGQTAISGRGPETFVDRTYEEIYNDAHFIGLWYAYSPDFLKPLATKLIGYGFEDRLKGGRLQYSTRAHINDHKARELLDDSMAINTHFKACIWMRKIYNSYYQQTKNPTISIKLANIEYKDFALKEMIEHPIRHLKFTLIFAWRGIWILNAIDGRTAYEMGQGKQEPWLKQMIPFGGFVSLIGLFIYGLKRQHHLLLLITVFPIAAYGFNSFFSHNLPRYGEQFLPVWLLALGFIALTLTERLQKRYVPLTK